jgi:uncharacterized protein YbbK (DUF523 family)
MDNQSKNEKSRQWRSKYMERLKNENPEKLEQIKQHSREKMKEYYQQNKALTLAQANHVTHAVLKANSPSCGSDGIYDGSFTGQKIAGE